MKLVLRKPVLTEKSSRLQEKENKYTFIVSKDANKIEIRKAIEAKFGVTVTDINTTNYEGKVKRMGRNIGRKSSFKKAVVSVKEGDKIEYYDV